MERIALVGISEHLIEKLLAMVSNHLETSDNMANLRRSMEREAVNELRRAYDAGCIITEQRRISGSASGDTTPNTESGKGTIVPHYGGTRLGQDSPSV